MGKKSGVGRGHKNSRSFFVLVFVTLVILLPFTSSSSSDLLRHVQLENDIAAYDEEIVRLEDAASIIAKAQEDNKKNQGVMSKSLVSMVTGCFFRDSTDSDRP